MSHRGPFNVQVKSQTSTFCDSKYYPQPIFQIFNFNPFQIHTWIKSRTIILFRLVFMHSPEAFVSRRQRDEFKNALLNYNIRANKLTSYWVLQIVIENKTNKSKTVNLSAIRLELNPRPAEPRE